MHGCEEQSAVHVTNWYDVIGHGLSSDMRFCWKNRDSRLRAEDEDSPSGLVVLVSSERHRDVLRIVNTFEQDITAIQNDQTSAKRRSRGQWI